MKEKWKPAPGYPGYEVSNAGKIRSVPRFVNSNGGKRHVPGCMLSPWLTPAGYFQVDLSGHRVTVHTVVALAWCKDHFAGAHVDHINGVRNDNRAKNLEWVTPSENVKRGFKNGRINPAKGKWSCDHPTSKPVLSRCLSTGRVRYWPAAMDAVRAGFSSDCISRCCTGKSMTHKGHKWRFAEHGVRWSDEQEAA